MPVPPSEEEVANAADVIRRLPKGHLPYQLFMAVASKVVTPTLELLVIQDKGTNVEILLTRRPDDDKYWPGQWHVPGTVIRSTDIEGSFDSCINRILTDELAGSVTIAKPIFVSLEFWEVERGREIDQLFYVNVVNSKQLPENARFFPINKLPENLMRHHSEVIDKIIERYKEDRN